jgi:uncharacterized protein YfkK (UPF0435 family)
VLGRDEQALMIIEEYSLNESHKKELRDFYELVKRAVKISCGY